MSDLHEHDHDHTNEHDHAHEHDHDHAYLHAHGIPHSHGHVHENQKAVINRLSRAIGHLEKVLEYYKDEPEKYKAACFLIENMASPRRLPFRFSF